MILFIDNIILNIYNILQRSDTMNKSKKTNNKHLNKETLKAIDDVLNNRNLSKDFYSITELMDNLNNNTIEAIKETEELINNPNKKTYNSFKELLDDIDNEYDLELYKTAITEYKKNPIIYTHEEVKKMLD